MANLVRKLAVASLTTRKVRTGLTIAAIAMSVSLVVAVTSGYASLEGAAFQYLTTPPFRARMTPSAACLNKCSMNCKPTRPSATLTPGWT
jgi:hypothetical protein